MLNQSSANNREQQQSTANKYPGLRREREARLIPNGSLCVFKAEPHHTGELVVILKMLDDSSSDEEYRVATDDRDYFSARRSQLDYITWGSGKEPPRSVKETIRRHGWRAKVRQRYDANSSRVYKPRDHYNVREDDVPNPPASGKKRRYKKRKAKTEPESTAWTRIDDELRVILTPGGAVILIGVIAVEQTVLVPYTVDGTRRHWEFWLDKFEVG